MAGRGSFVRVVAVAAMALAGTSATAMAGPQHPLEDGAWWADTWTGSISKVSTDGFLWGVAMSDVTYQGAEATPTLVPRVGQRFYVRIRTSMLNYIGQAGFRMSVLLPAGVDADITSAQDVVCGLTDQAGTVLTPGPGECQDPFRNGLYWQFPTMTLRSGETGWYWFPAKATQVQTGSQPIQMLSKQMTNLIGALPDPMVSSVPLRVDPAATTVPSPPLGLWTVAGNNQATATWSAPSSNGGASITGYQVTFRPASGSTYACATTGALTCTSTALLNGVTYTVTVTATNSQGTSLPSAATTVTPQASAVAATPPSAPRLPKSYAGTGTEGVSWTAPESDGGSAITRYTAYAYAASIGGTPVGSCTTAQLSCTIPGTNSPATKYWIDVEARNGIGVGPRSTPRVESTQAQAFGYPPCPVTVDTAVPGPGSATVSWHRRTVSPGGCGGTMETIYRARAYDATGRYLAKCETQAPYPTVPATTCTIPGLPGGGTVAVDVVAWNWFGWGNPSNALGVTPLAVASDGGAPPPTSEPTSPAAPTGDVASVGPTTTAPVALRPPVRLLPPAPAWVRASAATGGALVAWRPRAQATGRVSYLVRAWSRARGGKVLARCTASHPRRSCRLRGIARGRRVYVAVATRTAAGLGAPSTPRRAVRAR